MSDAVQMNERRVNGEGVLIIDNEAPRAGRGRRWLRVAGIVIAASAGCALVFLGVERYRHGHHHHPHGPHDHHHGSDDEFRAWMTAHNKEYDSLHEYMLRRDIFFHNKGKVERHNDQRTPEGLLGASAPTYSLKLNHFADLTADEFSQMHASCYLGGAYKTASPAATLTYNGEDLPDKIDHRDNGAVTPVKNQGQCGSCWSFSVTGAVEGHWFLYGKNGKKIDQIASLSEQQLIDCSKPEGNMGCNGGLMDAGFTFEENVGICTEESYPYTAKEGKCMDGTGENGQNEKCDVAVPHGQITGFHDVQQYSTKALMKAVKEGPVSIAIEADKKIFQFYHGGVMKDTAKMKCGKQLDHGVLLVGYGTEKGVDYWLVKNSWGENWGKNGYIKLFRDVDDKTEDGDDSNPGTCGILLSASFPIVKEEVNPNTLAAPDKSHYGNPTGGCMSDEQAVKIGGLDGGVCTPKCDGSGNCPKDTPPGTEVQGQCALKGPDGSSYCALICAPKQGKNGGCPPTAQCDEVQEGVGICMYPDASAVPATTVSMVKEEKLIFQ